MEIITIAALLVVATISVIAVFNKAFKDTIVQRICLSGFCIGSLSLAWNIFNGMEVSEHLMFGSVLSAVWGLEATRKVL